MDLLKAMSGPGDPSMLRQLYLLKERLISKDASYRERDISLPQTVVDANAERAARARAAQASPRAPSGSAPTMAAAMGLVRQAMTS